ncbi:MAG TPA: hypothetical protein P5313_09825 [Spirochaetia bacterium]|nr:hypothetical protein [Spirochaetia bacterium]
MKHATALVAFVLAAAAASAQFPYGLSDPSAQENFRLGVQAYHRGRTPESILLFERVLSFNPRDPLSLFWLGRAYFKNGLESTALDRWEAAAREGGRSLLIESFQEFVSSRRAVEPGMGRGGYVSAGEIPGLQGRETRFLRPSWIHPLRDGGFLLVSHGTGEILRVDVNGVVRARFRGGVGGFDRPFSLAPAPDGGFWVSEFQGDRISRCDKDGNVLSRIGGGKGRERLTGPQYLASDSGGFLFAVDFGNGRVVKYSPSGEFLLEFGRSSPVFPGFRSPTGIAVRDGKVYVADAFRKAIYVFDDSGNYLESFAEGSLLGPEGMTFAGNGELLVADRRRVLAADTTTYEIRELYRSPRPAARLVSATLDANGNVLAADYDASSVDVLSDPAVVYGGYFLEIERIRADSFPVVEADVYVRDRFGNPVVGLDQGNFYASEQISVERSVKEGETEARIRTETLTPVRELELVGRLSDTPGVSVALVVERSPGIDAYRSEVRQAVESVASGLGDPSEAFLVTAGRVPALQGTASGSSGGPVLARQAISAEVDPLWRFDAALRLAVSTLTERLGRSAVVYITTGTLNEARFEGPTLSELGTYLRNNGIRFYAVVVGDAPVSEAVRYLAGTAGGGVYRVWEPAGLGRIGRDLQDAASGRYRIRFTSAADPGFGRSYLRIAVEAYLFRKSGRDESGYFAPLR